MVKDYRHLWKSVSAKGTKRSMAVQTLVQILLDEEGRKFVANLEHKSDLELCFKILDHGITSDILKSDQKKAFFVMLIVTSRRLYGIHQWLPESMLITEKIKVQDQILASSGYADTRKGNYSKGPVAVKTFRVNKSSDPVKLREIYYNKVILWNKLSHPNVLKLIGVYEETEKGSLSAVTELMAGSIIQYIRVNHVNRLELLSQAARGLEYLHDFGVAHGDIKGANILISNDKPARACLADFDFSTMNLDPLRQISVSGVQEAGVRCFMSPELLMPQVHGLENPTATPEGDIYAFALTIYEVLTGKTPFPGVLPAQLVFFVPGGLRPNKPANASAIGFSDSLWSFTERCWGHEKNSRPEVAEIVIHLAEAVASWHGLMPPCKPAEDVEIGSPDEPTAALAEFDAVFGAPDADQESFTEFTPVSSLFDPRVTSSVLSAEPFSDPVDSDPQQNNEPPSFQHPGFIQTRTPYRRHTVDIAPTLRSSSRLVQSTSNLLLHKTGDITRSQEAPNIQDLIDRTDKVLENSVDDSERRKMLIALCKMCSNHGYIPQAMYINMRLDEDLIAEYAGNSTVVKGTYKDRQVAVKVVHVYQTSNCEKDLQEFVREAVTWRHLRHPNVLPLIGVDERIGRLVLVSEWMVHGNINNFVKVYEGVNRLQLLVDTAIGLEYMHSFNVVHGDLKGANILINKNGRACLADFGLSTIVCAGHRASFATSSESLVSFTPGGTIRWMSPELLLPEQFGHSDDRPTKQSDCYALGMVVYEVLCGKHPYWEIENNTLVTIKILEGVRPKKPQAAESLGFTDRLWDMVIACWLETASERPDVKTVLSHLNNATWSWERRELL